MGGAVVVAKWLDSWFLQSCEVLSLTPPGARAFFFSSINVSFSVLNQIPQERCIFTVFPIITLAVLPEAKQA